MVSLNYKFSPLKILSIFFFYFLRTFPLTFIPTLWLFHPLDIHNLSPNFDSTFVLQHFIISSKSLPMYFVTISSFIWDRSNSPSSTSLFFQKIYLSTLVLSSYNCYILPHNSLKQLRKWISVYPFQCLNTCFLKVRNL